MKTLILLGPLIAATLALAGCDLSSLRTAAAASGKIAANSGAACGDIAALGYDVTAIAGQVAAANPASAKAQAANARIQAGASAANTDCLVVAGLYGLVDTTVQAAAAAKAQ